MRRILLDTHAFLWFVFDDPRLSQRATALIEDAGINKSLSIVSLWEIVIKSQIGKLSLGMSVTEFFDRFVTGRELELVDIRLHDLLAYDELPLAHRDPFDRLLVAQARVMDAPILSADAAFSKYPVERIW